MPSPVTFGSLSPGRAFGYFFVAPGTSIKEGAVVYNPIDGSDGQEMVGEHRKTQAGGAKGSGLVSVRESMQTGRFSPVMTIAERERESKVICCWLKARVWSCVMK